MHTLAQYAQETANDLLLSLSGKYPRVPPHCQPVIERADERLRWASLPPEAELWFWQELDRQLWAQRPLQRMSDGWMDEMRLARGLIARCIELAQRRVDERTRERS